MLWEKESNTSDALYIDLLKNVNHSLENFRLNRKKSNALSLRTRTDGNRKYSENDVDGAMEMYNQSICFAENDSEHLSLGYANRSSCFLKLRMYDRCLVDIQLAKDAKYPERLMPKLEDRKRECIKRLQSEVQPISTEPTLSFDADVKLPCLANVLQIEKNAQYGRLVTAKRDIQIGETVLVEEAYIHIVYGVELNKCTNCAKEKMNFIPCANCVDAMYCSEKCANNHFHETECDIVLGSNDCCDGESLSFILRSVIIGINTFGTINEMMEFVEDRRLTDPHEITESIATTKSKYGTFLKLSSFAFNSRISDYRKSAYIIFKAIMGSSKLSTKFQSKASQRFLMHLIVHHGLILRMNAFSGYSEPISGYFGDGSVTEDDDGKQFEKELHLITSYFNHSCIPNVIKLGKDNVAVCKALLPIKQGEQLFITYIDDEAFNMTEKERNDQLENIYGFRCKCQICTTGMVKGGEHLLQTDSAFKYVVTNVPRLIGNFDIDLVRDIKTKCIEFLTKHPHMIASREAAFVLTNLGALLEKELNRR